MPRRPAPLPSPEYFESFVSYVDLGDGWGPHEVFPDELRDADGYSRIPIRRPGDRTQWYRAHRIAWRLKHGEIDDGLVLDHLCRVRACVNVRHLEPVTQQVNTWRGEAPAGVNHRRETCKRGHRDWVVKMYRGYESRRCAECDRIYQASKSKKHKESRPA